MSQFYISSEVPEHDLQRCHRSREFRRWLAITGATEEGEIKLFEGVVQSVEDKGENAPKGKRFAPSAQGGAFRAAPGADALKKFNAANRARKPLLKIDSLIPCFCEAENRVS
jgi:hypothetical protein